MVAAARKQQKTNELKLTHDDAAARGAGLWPEPDDSVDAVEIKDVLQFLESTERVHFVNELHRVMKKGARAQFAVPHWCTSRVYGDLACKMPPVTEAWLFHLNEKWRKENAPWGVQYTCDFDTTFGYGMHPLIVSRNEEYQRHALTFFKEAAQDLVATLVKR